MNFVTSSEKMFKTTNYDEFKRVKGNRKVLEERVVKILASIDKIGYIPIPLVVNENMEVIDGQGRLEACSRRGLPVNFIIKPGLKIEDCITMNINVTPWNLMDFIECYAEIGNASYQLILNLYNTIIDKYGARSISVNLLCSTLFNTKKAPGKAIKSGRLAVTPEMFSEALDCLIFAYDLLEEIKANKLRLQSNDISDFLTALVFCYKWKNVDNKRLHDILVTEAHQMNKWASVENCLTEIEYLYNRNRKYEYRCPSLLRLWEDTFAKDRKMFDFSPVETNLQNKEEE